MNSSTYPVNPSGIPSNFISLPSSYKFRAFLAILAIALFFVLYAALVYAFGWLTYFAITYDIGDVNKFTILLKIAAILGSVALLAFTVKFIFKLKNHKPSNRIKLNMSEHPELQNFVNQICKDTGAPKPKNVYVDPDVNAYVSYTNMWQSLLLPTSKDLTIGMGLVSCINLSEFKAITAHEFGHFAQKSMKIGSYIVSANTIIHDMIFNRDKWDDLLDTWRSSDIRLSAAAWIITPVIWLIRQLLSLFYQLLNIMHSSLSREMEFNADKVAVSVSGSDAIVSSLWRLDGGSVSWNSTVNHIYLAGQKNNFIKNAYHHLAVELDNTKTDVQLLLDNLPEDIRGGKQYFSTSENSKVGMYASHPPNDLRENNAKLPYIHCKEDERSPWLLFSNPEKIQEQMTMLLYKEYLQKVPQEFIEDKDFETFIAQEQMGKELLEEYDNTFTNRFLNLPEQEELAPSKSADILARIAAHKLELKELMVPVLAIESNMELANEIAQGTSHHSSFTFQDKNFNKKNLNEGYELLVSEREKLFTETFTSWDRELCELYLALAAKYGKEQKLLDLYDQHRSLNLVYRTVAGIRVGVINQLNTLQQRTDVEEREIQQFSIEVKSLFNDLNNALNKLDDATFVPLPNIDTAEELRMAIVDGGSFTPASGEIFKNGGFDKMFGQLEAAIQHLQRIDQKSISQILTFHHQLTDMGNT